MQRAEPNEWRSHMQLPWQGGRFYLFTSNGEETLGKDRTGRFCEDVSIARLERDADSAVVFAPVQ